MQQGAETVQTKRRASICFVVLLILRGAVQVTRGPRDLRALLDLVDRAPLLTVYTN